MIERLSDWFRELLISFYRLQMGGGEQHEVLYWFDRMRDEIAKRSAAQIKRMERERGLL